MSRYNMKEIMLDIETMGNSQNSVIVSIGAVQFDFNKEETGREFYVKVSIESCMLAGLTFTASTIEWWLKQSHEARHEIGVDTISLKSALESFANFVDCCKKDTEDGKVNIWGNPASFDIGIMANAYEKTGTKIPWHYRNERDLRTLVSLAPEIKDSYPTVGTLHQPIDDCKTQIGYAKLIWKT